MTALGRNRRKPGRLGRAWSVVVGNAPAAVPEAHTSREGRRGADGTVHGHAVDPRSCRGVRVNEQAGDSDPARAERLGRAGGLGPRPEWVDLRSAAALTGVAHCDLAWALAEGAVAYSTTRPGHRGVPMVRLADVQQLAQR